MSRALSRRSIWLLFLVPLLLSSLACDPPEPEVEEARLPEDLPASPAARLRALMDRARETPELSRIAGEEIERLVALALPEAAPPRAWRTSYVDLAAGDFTVVDLVEDPEGTATRLVWAQIVDRPDLSPEERRRYGADPIRGFPTRGVEDHHLFVLAGEVEVRLVTASDEFRDSERLRQLLERFDLELLASW